MKDKILIQQLEAHCILGVEEFERKSPQKILLDLEMTTDITKAAQVDKIEVALDYEKICEHLHAFIAHSHFHLIESLAEACVCFLFEKFPIEEITLRVFKPKIIPNVEKVGVEIQRKR